jgi:hypothetical protein
MTAKFVAILTGRKVSSLNEIRMNEEKAGMYEIIQS